LRWTRLNSNSDITCSTTFTGWAGPTTPIRSGGPDDHNGLDGPKDTNE